MGDDTQLLGSESGDSAQIREECERLKHNITAKDVTIAAQKHNIAELERERDELQAEIVGHQDHERELRVQLTRCRVEHIHLMKQFKVSDDSTQIIP